VESRLGRIHTYPERTEGHEADAAGGGSSFARRLASGGAEKRSAGSGDGTKKGSVHLYLSSAVGNI
jgi:hypothetical protein